MANVDNEFGPEEEAAAYAELVKQFEELFPEDSDERFITIRRPDGGFLDLMRADDGRMLLSEGPDKEYYVSEAGELVRLEPKPAPEKAADFAEVLRTGTRLEY